MEQYRYYIKNIKVEKMDLISGYLLIIIMLFTANLALLAGNYNINNIILIGISLGFSIVSLVLMNISLYFKDALSFMPDYFGYYFLAVAILTFAVMLYYRRDSEHNLSVSICLLAGMLLISIVLLAGQSDLTLLDSMIYSLATFMVMFFVYMITKLLVHAKREYPVIIGEYMTLASILISIFALTYYSAATVNYSMFSSFLILTPTYQLIYVIIALAVVMIIGLLFNDFRGGSS